MLKAIYKFASLFPRAWNKFIATPMKKKMMASCGKDVSFGRGFDVSGWENVSVGNDVSIGERCMFLTTRAKIIVGDHVMFAPQVSVVTGNHITDIPGRYMTNFTDSDKRPEDDQDVIFEGDNWIGANSTILKGVTIGYGAVVAAGAVVSKSVPPFSYVGGIPAKVIKMRFDEETVKELLAKKNNY
ncbi:MAG: acyltransferase [Clostridia bacterium]|nr:acyltransferase [Clostridia bacterium]